MPPDRRLVAADCERPARMDGTCFYCRQPVGGLHVPNCVAFKRRVRVRAVIEYEIDVPASWSKEQIEFHRNEGSWCADNMIDEISAIGGEDGCLCAAVQFTYLDDVEEGMNV